MDDFATAYPINAAYSHERAELLDAIDTPFRRVLDVGCSDGATGRALRRRNPDAEIVGFDIDPEAVRRAATIYDAAHVVDLDAGIPAVGRFDLIVLADVLEHLKRPDEALAALVRDHLEAGGGGVIVSLPNIQTWWALWTILRGRFPRKPAGLWDATHLRWFTRHEAEALFAGAGLKVERMHRVLRLSEHRRGGPLRAVLRLAPTLFTAQMVFALRPR